MRFLAPGLTLVLFLAAEVRLLTLAPLDRWRPADSMALLLLIFALPLAVLYVRNRSRLSRTVRQFHAAESRRHRFLYAPFLTLTLGGAAVIVYIGGRRFLADPTVATVILTLLATLVWLTCFPQLFALIIRLSSHRAPIRRDR